MDKFLISSRAKGDGWKARVVPKLQEPAITPSHMIALQILQSALWDATTVNDNLIADDLFCGK